MNSAKRQAGLGFAGWIILVMLFGGVMTIGMKLFPIYLDNSTMSRVLDDLSNENGLAGRPDRIIYEMITKRFKINNIREYKIRDIVKIKRTNDRTDLVMSYETRVPFVGNVDLIASFHKQVVLRN
jgi:hypothetical protein